MNSVFTAFLISSLAMSAVIVLLALINRVTAHKVPAALRYYMWLIVLAGLLIPFRPNMPALFKPVKIPVLFEVQAEGQAREGQPSANAEPITKKQSAAIRESSAPVTANPFPFSVTQTLFALWLIGAAAVLAFHFYSYRKFALSVRRWGTEPKDSKIISALTAAQNEMGLTGWRTRVKTFAPISSPMLIGFFSPTILLPEKFIAPDELDHIFKHELTHFKRGDVFVNLLVLIASAAHWFNPFVYLMAKEIRADREASCDEAVVAGDNRDTRKQYIETIIGFVGTGRERTPALSTYFYGGSSIMKKRLFAIMDTGRKSKWLALACCVTVLASTFVSGNAFAATGVAASTAQAAITEDEAKAVALEDAGVTAENATFTKIKLGREDRRRVYELKFYSGDTKYDYEIDAVTAEIREFDRETKRVVTSSTTAADPAQYIGEDAAKAIALEDAGFAEANVTRLKVKLDIEKRKVVYEVEFEDGWTEYDYEIDAVSGAINEADVEYDD